MRSLFYILVSFILVFGSNGQHQINIETSTGKMYQMYDLMNLFQGCAYKAKRTTSHSFSGPDGTFEIPYKKILMIEIDHIPNHIPNTVSTAKAYYATVTLTSGNTREVWIGRSEIPCQNIVGYDQDRILTKVNIQNQKVTKIIFNSNSTSESNVDIQEAPSTEKLRTLQSKSGTFVLYDGEEIKFKQILYIYGRTQDLATSDNLALDKAFSIGNGRGYPWDQIRYIAVYRLNGQSPFGRDKPRFDKMISKNTGDRLRNVTLEIGFDNSAPQQILYSSLSSISYLDKGGIKQRISLQISNSMLRSIRFD